MNECHPKLLPPVCFPPVLTNNITKENISSPSKEGKKSNLINKGPNVTVSKCPNAPMSHFLTHYPVTKAPKLQANIWCRYLSSHAQPPNSRLDLPKFCTQRAGGMSLWQAAFVLLN